MNVDWEVVLSAAFGAIGVLEYIKGFYKGSPSYVWRILQPVLCLGFAAVAAFLPAWVMTGILALALSQVGYELILDGVRKKLAVRTAERGV